MFQKMMNNGGTNPSQKTGWFRQVSALLVAKITEGTTLYTGFWVGLEDSFGRLLGQMSNPEILFPVLLVVFVVQAVPSLYFFFHVQSSS